MIRHSRTAVLVLVAGLVLTTMSVAVAQRAQVIPATRYHSATISVAETARNVRPDPPGRPPFAIPNKFKIDAKNVAGIDGGSDPVIQLAEGRLASSVLANFDGSSDDDNAALLGYRLVPPDTEGDVGPNHYVQWINSVSEIFDKSGTSLLGPFAGRAYFSGLGSDCETDNDGDPIVLYDEQADRWLVSQFSVSASPYSMCVAISQTPDPTGNYYQYEFSFGSDFPDYPKLGIWGDSYVMTTRDFRLGAIWAGISAIALDRNAMLSGNAASGVRFANAFGSISDGALPADADGSVSGPAIFGAHGNDGDTTFELWELDVDWTNPGAATFTSIPGVSISAYDGSVPSANQPNGQTLDVLSGFTMHRLNVRDFGTHLSMVANHTVETWAGTAGIRWYEFRNTGGNWTLHQEGTYSPDTDDRWMGSIAINAAGEIALGYSVSSSSRFPSIYVTGQTAAASGTGVMDIAEAAIINGSGAQSGASRWGDYSMMSVDPSNDTFWFTSEYYASTASFDFNTRIANFQLGTPTPATAVGVASIVTGTQSAGKGQKNGTATVTIRDDNGLPGAGYTVTVDFSGTFNESASGVTDSQGTATVVTTGSAKRDVVVNACVSDVVGGALTYDPNLNADPAYSCGPSGTPTSVHVASITTGTEGLGGGDKRGTATVTLEDDLGGSAGAGYSVAGNFSGTFSEPASEVTAADGTVTFTTSGTAKGKVTVDFCVSGVTGGSLHYNSAEDAPGTTCTTAPISKGDIAMGPAEVIQAYELDQNYPNPFMGATLISYALKESGPVRVSVYNMLGQEIAVLADGFQEARRHTVGFDASGLSGGMYLYMLEAGGHKTVRQMMLMK